MVGGGWWVVGGGCAFVFAFGFGFACTRGGGGDSDCDRGNPGVILVHDSILVPPPTLEGDTDDVPT